jgi:nitrogen regulatory protein P-II 1
MSYKMIFAIVRDEKRESVEEALNQLGVPGLSISRIKGYGEYINFYSRDWLTDRSKLVVMVEEASVKDTIEAICKAAHTGVAGDGVIAVVPVEQMVHIEAAI